MRNNKKSKLFSLAVLTSMIMPLVTSCEPTANKSQDATSNEDKKNENIPESVYKDVGVAFNDATYIYDGQEKVLKCDESSLPAGVTVTYENNTRTAIGTNVVTAKFKGSDGTLYKDKTAKLIIKAPNDGTINWYSLITFNAKTFEYDGNEHSIYIDNEESVIPDGFAVKYENNGKVDAGIYTVTARVYNKNTGVSHYTAQATITIKKKTFDMAAIKANLRFNADSTSIEGGETYYNYDYSPVVTHRLEIVAGLDSRLKAFYSNNERTEEGINIVKIYFTSQDKNYEDPSSITVNMRVRITNGVKISFYRNQTQILDSITVSGGDNCPLTADELISRAQKLTIAEGYIVSLTDENKNKLLNVTQNVDIYFTFTPRKYKVTYSLSNFISNDNITEYTYGEVPDSSNRYNLVAPVVNDGYYFEGWYLRPDYSESSRVTSLGTVASDITIYGHVIRNNTSVMSFISKNFVYDGKAKTLAVEGNLPSDINIDYTYYKLTKEEGKTDYTVSELDEAPSEIGVYKVIAKFTDKVGTKYASDMSAFLTIVESSYDDDLVFSATSFDYNASYKPYPEVSNVPADVTVKYVYYIYKTTTDKSNVSTSTLYTYDVTLPADQVDDTHFNTLPVEPGNYLVEAIFTVPSTHEEIENMYSYLTINKLRIVIDKDRVFPDVVQGFVSGEEVTINPITSAIPTKDGKPLATVSAVVNNVRSTVGSQIATAYFKATDPEHYYDPDPIDAILTVNQNNSHRVNFYYINSTTGTIQQIGSTRLVADGTAASAPIIDRTKMMAEGGLRFTTGNDDFFTADYFAAFDQKWFPCDEDGHIIDGESNIENVIADTNFVLTYVPKKYTVNFNVTNGTKLDPISYVAYHPFYSAYYEKTDGDTTTNVYNGFSFKATNTKSATANNYFTFLGWLEQIPTDPNVDRSDLYIKNDKTINGHEYLFAYGNHTLTADIRGNAYNVTLRAEIKTATSTTYQDINNGTFKARYLTALSTSSYDATDKKIDQAVTWGYDFADKTIENFSQYYKEDDSSLYSFIGYYDEFGNQLTKDSILNSPKDQKITLKFDVKKVTVSFLYGNGNDNITQTWNYNDTLGKTGTTQVTGTCYLPADPTRDGYKFLGWTYLKDQVLELSPKADGSNPDIRYDASGSGVLIVGYAGTTAKKISEILSEVNGVKFADRVELKAVWVKQAITVTYLTNNEASDPDKPTIKNSSTVLAWKSTKTVYYSDTFGSDAAPELEAPSYKFLGWYYGDTKITKDNVVNFTGANNNIILTAMWETVEYDITYILNNDSTESTITQTVRFDATYTIPDFTAPVGCTSYTVSLFDLTGAAITNFIISNKDADLAKTNNLVNKSFKKLGIHQSFVAVLSWTGEEVYLSFKEEDGVTTTKDSQGNNIADRKTNFKVAYGTLPTPVKKGYTFGGWFYGTTRITTETLVSTTDSLPPTIEVNGATYKNLILKAKWLANSYVINYSPNNGSNAQAVTVNFNDKVFLPKNYTKKGYILNGWLDDDGTVYREDFTYTFDTDINLRANWVAKTYKVSYYDVNGAFKTSKEVQFGQKFNEILATYPYEQFFPGKEYDVDGSDLPFSANAYAFDASVPQFVLDNGSIVDLNSYICNQDLDSGDEIRLTAYGKPKTFTITFDLNRSKDVDGLVEGDASDDVATIMSCTYGQPFTPLSAPTRKGFTFVSWQYKHVFNASEKLYGELAADESINFNSFNQITDLIATAQWKAISYRVTFNYYNSDKGNESQIYSYFDDNGNAKQDVYVGSKVQMPDGNSEYLPKHYKFLYWQNERDSTQKIYSDQEYVFSETQDLSFRAVYQEELDEEYQKLFVNLKFVNAAGTEIAHFDDVYCGKQLSGLPANSKFTYGSATLETDTAGMLVNPFTRFDSEGNDRYGVGKYITLTAAPVISDFTVTNKAEIEAKHTKGTTLDLAIVLQGSNVPSIADAISSGLLSITSSKPSVCLVNGTKLTFNAIGECQLTVKVNNITQVFNIVVG